MEGGGGDFPEGAGAVDAALPVANANLDVAPGIEVGSVELEADAVESGVDAVKDGYQFGGGAVRGSCGVQHQIAYRAIEAFRLFRDLFNRPTVDADYQGVGTYDVSMRKETS